MQDLIEISPPVAAALSARRAVVALESTILSHGMPFPQNMQTGLMLEAAVREQGATPATIAVIEGRLRVGLEQNEIESLCRAAGSLVKATRRDLAALMIAGASAGTTVAATMRIAELAGIEIFATGGIGGVHRGAETSFDISADLVELARSKVAVVCAGAKSILDLAKTLEFLETHGVPIIGFGCDEFPAFYAQSSGLRLDHRSDDPQALARIVRLQQKIGPGGLLIVNPAPQADALDGAAIEAHIGQAVDEARRQGVGQKQVTPWLLRRVVELTGGGALKANVALAQNNAALAGKIAAELAQL